MRIRCIAGVALVSICTAAQGAQDAPIPVAPALSPYAHDLLFTEMPTLWDEGVPLGNGMLGALVWEKQGKLRLALDRADLWDLRPVAVFSQPNWRYRWMRDQWKAGTYDDVIEQFDSYYENIAGPSKIPAGALEFDIGELGPVVSVRLYLKDALCEVLWASGARLLTFVHATQPHGWYRFEGGPKRPAAVLLPPAYAGSVADDRANSLVGLGLANLGYKQGKLTRSGNTTRYVQEGWGGFAYSITVTETRDKDAMTGIWSIGIESGGDANAPGTVLAGDPDPSAAAFRAAWESHRDWWRGFWNKSLIGVPDENLMRQYYRDMYKFGSVARSGAPPISLQAIWTADNGRLPPWRGDYHNDLNVQLSYWPAYGGNRLDEAGALLDWLWANRGRFKRYTRTFFELDGLNVPGASTLDGSPIGGWSQYAFQPTVSSWLAHHFYLQWRYSGDRDFLSRRAYPWLRDVATYLDEISIRDEDGRRRLPMSSSPEIHDNRAQAWFRDTTNFDLGLIRWTYAKAAELADALKRHDEARAYRRALSQWPELAVDESGLLIAPKHPLRESHRHFSHLIAYHPLGLIDPSNGADHRSIIDRTIATLEDLGTDWWVGYSFAWMANLLARNGDGDAAASYLRLFADNFVLRNSFHANGDQSNSGLSQFTYRPFTLEGNFAFAAGLQEMLIQSHTDTVRIFPAIPEHWLDVRFDGLRAEGAFVVSAQRQRGVVTSVRIESEQGWPLRLANPFAERDFSCNHDHVADGADLAFDLPAGAKLVCTAAPAP